MNRNIRKHEWLYAWHYARLHRRRGQFSDCVGPQLRLAVRAVMQQDRDVLAARVMMGKSCGPKTAFIYTTDEFMASIAPHLSSGD